MKTNRLPSQERLKELFRYDPETGQLFWATREESNRVPPRFAGKEALSSFSPSGYKRGSIGRVSVRAHRVIFKLVHDQEPEEVDHINGDRSDNRIANLRASTRRENMANLARRRNGELEVPVNVIKSKSGMFRSQIHFRGRKCYLGTFATAEEAAAAAVGAIALTKKLAP